MQVRMYVKLLYMHIACILSSCTYSTTVTLTSSADSVCPGDTVVFTCVTDTGQLLWISNGHNSIYYSAGQPARTVHIFTTKLCNVSGMTFISTATVHNVQLSHSGTVITCSDHHFQGTSVNKTVQLSGIYNFSIIS